MMSMPLELKELLHNLKDRSWDVNPVYQIDENEGQKIIKALSQVSLHCAMNERPNAHWIRRKMTYYYTTYECSVCGRDYKKYTGHNKWYNYCPNCGSKMEGKE